MISDFEFKKKMMDINIRDTLKYCYQCNRCTDECPVAKIEPQRYNPRRNILESFLGLKSQIFDVEDKFGIWGCTVCDTCDEVCPQKIELTEIFYILKNMSIQKGEGPSYYTTQASSIYDFGKAIPSQPAIERRRGQLGLPEIEPPNVEEVQKMLNETKLNKVLNK